MTLRMHPRILLLSIILQLIVRSVRPTALNMTGNVVLARAVNYEERLASRLALIQYAKHVYLNECEICRMASIVRGTLENMSGAFIAHLTEITRKQMTYIITRGYDERIIHDVARMKLIGYSDINFIFIDSENLELFKQLVRHLKRLPFWLSRGRLLVIVCNIKNPTRNWYEPMLRYLWDRKITNACITFWNDLSYQINTLTYYGYKNYTAVVNISGEQWEGNIFQNKVTRKNLAGHSVNVYTFGSSNRIYGMNVTGSIEDETNAVYIESIRYSLNADYNVFSYTDLPEDQRTYELIFRNRNKTLSSRLEEFFLYTIHKYDIDIFFDANSIFNTERLESLPPHAQDDLCVVIHGARIKPSYLYILLIFKPQSWIVIVVCFLFVSVVFKYIIRRGRITLSESLLMMFRGLLNTSMNFKSPNRASFKIFVTAWHFVGLVISGSVVSVLLKVLLVPKFYQNINTLNELLDIDNFTLYAFPQTLEQFTELWGENNRFARLLAPINFTVDTANMFERMCIMSKHHMIGLMLTPTDAKRFIMTCEMAESVGLYGTHYHVVRESPLPKVNTFNTPMGSQYQPALTNAVLLLSETGLRDKWLSRYRDQGVRFYTRIFLAQRYTDELNQLAIIKLKNLILVFGLLLIGCSIALLLFLCELYWGRKRPQVYID